MKIDDKKVINKIKELSSAILDTVNEKNSDKGLIKTNVVSILTLCDVVEPCDIEQDDTLALKPLYAPYITPYTPNKQQVSLDFTSATKEQHD